ncbi:hypothetical protein [Nonomuraea sp. NPDC001699]
MGAITLAHLPAERYGTTAYVGLSVRVGTSAVVVAFAYHRL